MAWSNTNNIGPKKYTCGYCGDQVASAIGYFESVSGSPVPSNIFVCPSCSRPTYFGFDGVRNPGVAPGKEVQHLPAEISSLYGEARKCSGIGAYTSTVLACRKLLMNIAVSHGAKEGESFVSYVEYLSTAGFVPPNGKGWVDYIRKKGNEATHEIALMTEDDATRLLAFVEMLLKFIYEFPAAIPAP